MSERVVWIEPRFVRGLVKWPKCQAKNGSIGAPESCALHAKVDYGGYLLCIRHAKVRALAQVLADSAVSSGNTGAAAEYGDEPCTDCPPIGYENNETRCDMCPRRNVSEAPC
jgi:hypothetical protein